MTLRRKITLLLAPLCLGLLLGGADGVDAKKGKKKNKKEFFYVHENPGGPASVRGYLVDKNGLLTELAGSPFALDDNGTSCGGDCGTLAYSSADKLLFAASSGGIVVFKVGKDGALTKVVGSPFGGFDSYGVATVRKGNRTLVYASDDGGTAVRGFEAATTGVLTELAGSPYGAGTGPVGVAATSRHVFVANQNGPSISTYSIAGSGVLTEVASSPTATPDLFFVKADASGRFVYAPQYLGATTVSGFRVHPSTGALQALPGQPYQVGLTAAAGLAMNQGLLMYALGGTAGGVNAQALLQNANGQLSNLGAGQTLTLHNLNSGALNQTGQLLGVAGDDGVATYRPSPATGVLTEADKELVTLADVSGTTFAKP